MLVPRVHEIEKLKEPFEGTLTQARIEPSKESLRRAPPRAPRKAITGRSNALGASALSVKPGFRGVGLHLEVHG